MPTKQADGAPVMVIDASQVEGHLTLRRKIMLRLDLVAGG